MFQLTSTHRPRVGNPAAAALVWQWRDAVSEGGATGWRNPRLRGSIQAAITLALGGAVWTLWSHVIGGVMLAAGSLVLLAALVSPTGLFAGIERALTALAQTVGRGVSWVLMTLLYYGFFVPFGRLFRSGRRDRMRRFYEPEAPSYWEARERGRSASDSRDRQY